MYAGPIIDCDIHHTWRSPADVVKYMTAGWQEFVAGPGPAGPLPISAPSAFQNPLGGNRNDTFPSAGGPPGSDYELMGRQLLDPLGLAAGVLTYGEGLFVDTNPNPFLAAEIARASNEWTREEWLARDDRLRGSILVSNQEPALAAQEIRRLGDDERMAQVLMSVNGLGPAFGHPIYHPIYEAAVEFGLPVALHAAGHGGNSPASAAHASANFYIEYHTLIMQTMMTHATSFISHGVFDRFPTLKLVLVEGGVAWVPAFLWRFDTEFHKSSSGSSTLTRPPSEYFHDHVRLTTQPLEFPADRQHLVDVLSYFDAEHILLFATDYPHWDTDELDHVAARLPDEWLANVLFENARSLYCDRAPIPIAHDQITTTR